MKCHETVSEGWRLPFLWRGEMLSTNLWELLWWRFRRGGRELGVAASTAWLFTSGWLVPRRLFLLLCNELTASPASFLASPPSLTSQGTGIYLCSTFYHQEPLLKSKRTTKQDRQWGDTQKKQITPPQNASTGNTGQPSKRPGVQLAPGDCTKFCL